MGFSSNNQQRITLSQYADNIIQNDCIMFKCLNKENNNPSYHTFINKIFCNYYRVSDASIEMRLYDKEKELHKFLEDDKQLKEIDTYIKKILHSYRAELEDKVNGFLSAKGFQSKVISLNNETLQIIEESDEHRFYSEKHVSKYIRAVIEDYARSNSLKRKRIYYQKTLEILDDCIKKNYIVKIEFWGRKKSHKIKPAFLCEDKFETHLYLAAILCRENKKEKLASYRIDRIKSIHLIRQEPISPDTFSALKNKADTFGIQYLSSEKTQIRIQLTPEGIAKYRQMSFQRPMYSKIEGSKNNIYVFEIPKYQVLVYFFKFGADAIVLEPAELREEFRRMYQKALKGYENSPIL